jgi:hypothetical protein
LYTAIWLTSEMNTEFRELRGNQVGRGLHLEAKKVLWVLNLIVQELFNTLIQNIKFKVLKYVFHVVQTDNNCKRTIWSIFFMEIWDFSGLLC